VTQPRGTVADITMSLWQRLASELVSIIGEGGFQSLFSRSVQLTRETYTWITPAQGRQRTDSQFPELQACLADREFSEASEASIHLLVTFCDVLAVLIGDTLTNSLLNSAWGEDTPGLSEKEVIT